MPNQLFFMCAALLCAATAQAGLAASPSHTSAICDHAARRAAKSEGVPLDILRAISRVETGRRQDGELAPWPWTINSEGQGYWFTSEFEAKSYVFKIFKSGKRSFDIGCFQINYRWHGAAFRSIDAMFDPDENARYAARFLKDLHQEFGSWSAAAGAYHSRTQEHADRYEARFEAVLAQITGAPPPQTTVAARDPFTHRAAPLVPVNAAPPQSNPLGSLVPDAGTATAFIAFN